MKAATDIRKWAVQNGFNVSPSGRLSKHVTDAYIAWAASASSTEREQLTKGSQRRHEDEPEKRDRIDLADLVQRIALFDRQNPNYQISFKTRYAPQFTDGASGVGKIFELSYPAPQAD